MADLAILLAFWAAFALAVASPGPNFAVILGTSVRSGRPAALRVAVGMVIGEAIWGFAAVFGIAALAGKHAWVETALQVGGGGFLLLLGLLSLRSALSAGSVIPTDEPRPRHDGILRGLLLMLLNPKAGVFWVSLTGLLLSGSAGPVIGMTAVAGAVAISAAWHSALALALTTRAVLGAYRRIRRGLESLLGVVLAGLGLRMILAD